MSQNDEIEQLVERVFALSRDYKHEYVTLEHLLAILLDIDDVQDIIIDMELDPNAIQRTLLTKIVTCASKPILPERE